MADEHGTPPVNEQLSELFGTLVRAGVPMEQVTSILNKRTGKRKGAPVSNRLPVLLAVEYKMLKPQLSWMRAAIKFCPCGKATHDFRCRERLRHQAMTL